MVASIYAQQQYREGPPVSGTTWNPADKGTGIVLAEGDLFVIFSPATGGVRSTTSRNAGKRYFSSIADTLVFGETPGVGFSNSLYDVETQPGLDDNCCLAYPYGSLFFNGLDNPGASWVAGDECGVAIDIDNGLMWSCVNGAFVGDPAAGTDGLDVSALCSGEVFALAGTYQEGVCSGDFNGTTSTYPPPSGFSWWDS